MELYKVVVNYTISVSAFRWLVFIGIDIDSYSRCHISGCAIRQNSEWRCLIFNGSGKNKFIKAEVQDESEINFIEFF